MSSDEFHAPDWLLLVLAVGCALLATVFVLFGTVVLDGELVAFDEAVRRWTMEGRHPLLIRFWEGITFLGDKPAMTALAILAGWRVFPRRRWWVPLLVLCAFTSTAFVDWLKETYQVVRPETGRRVSSSLSFPSGHASGAAAMAVLVAYMAARHRVHAWLFAGGGAVFLVLVGVSRIYLDRHWASDVAAGWVVGAAIGGAFCFVYEWLLRHGFGLRKRAVPRVER